MSEPLHPVPRTTTPVAAEVLRNVSRANVLRLAQKRLKKFARLEHKVIEDKGTDPVHDFRVASRRLQQLMDLLWPKPRPSKIRKSRKAIQRSRRLFSHVRNCDVLLEFAELKLRRKSSAHRDAWCEIKEHLNRQRASRFKRALPRLHDLDLHAVCLHLSQGMEEQMASADPKPAEIRRARVGFRVLDQSLQSRFGSEIQRLWTDFQQNVEQSKNGADMAALHPVRIAGKRLRYLLEIGAETGPRQTGATLSTLKRIQKKLGAWHDLVVLEEIIEEMLRRPKFHAKRAALGVELQKIGRQVRRTRENYGRDFHSMMSSGGLVQMRDFFNAIERRRPPARMTARRGESAPVSYSNAIA